MPSASLINACMPTYTVGYQSLFHSGGIMAGVPVPFSGY